MCIRMEARFLECRECRIFFLIEILSEMRVHFAITSIKLKPDLISSRKDVKTEEVGGRHTLPSLTF